VDRTADTMPSGRPLGVGWRFFEGGEVRLALLSLLEEGSQHGYELMKALETRSDGLHRPSAGTVYPTLQQVQDEGLVTSAVGDGGKRIYTLTEADCAVLEAEAEPVAAIWERAKKDEWADWSFALHPDAAEVMKPVFRLMRAAIRSTIKSRSPERAEQVSRFCARPPRKSAH
jgi:DNA-binding PadR family transcriptional regulator